MQTTVENKPKARLQSVLWKARINPVDGFPTLGYCQPLAGRKQEDMKREQKLLTGCCLSRTSKRGFAKGRNARKSVKVKNAKIKVNVCWYKIIWWLLMFAPTRAPLALMAHWNGCLARQFNVDHRRGGVNSFVQLWNIQCEDVGSTSS